MPPPRAERPYDLVLFGATGFTGRLVAHELANEPGLAWALAGRSRDKLERLRDELVARNPAAAHLRELSILVADSRDPRALQAVAAQTRVVCTTVGPYDLLGEPLVEACVAEGTDYCDLTGETPFIRRMVDRYHERARQTGARIVHCCGFDSIPSDIGVLALQREALARFGRPATRVRLHVLRAVGGFSGGTVASLLNIADRIGDPAVRRVLADPYALNPEGQRQGPDGRDDIRPRRDPSSGRWNGPFLMAPVNTRVVRRSHALLGHPWGENFRYDEVMSFGRGPRGLAMATAMSAGLVGFMGAVSVAPVRDLLTRHVLPKPGEGPSEKTIREGYFEARVIGEIGGDIGAERLELAVHGQGDPGYGATSRMLAQSALALVAPPSTDDTTASPSSLPRPLAAGVLTPASALGEALIDRLHAVGVTFTPA